MPDLRRCKNSALSSIFRLHFHFIVAIFAKFAVIEIPATKQTAFFAFDIALRAIIPVVFFAADVAFRQVTVPTAIRTGIAQT
jgi:hypothetical protein